MRNSTSTGQFIEFLFEALAVNILPDDIPLLVDQEIGRKFLHVVSPSDDDARPRRSLTETQGSCCSCTAEIHKGFDVSMATW